MRSKLGRRGPTFALGSLQRYTGLILVGLAGIITKGDIFLNSAKTAPISNGINLSNAVGAFTSRGILAVGETLVILTGGIDLSVGSLLGLSSIARLDAHALELVPGADSARRGDRRRRVRFRRRRSQSAAAYSVVRRHADAQAHQFVVRYPQSNNAEPYRAQLNIQLTAFIKKVSGSQAAADHRVKQDNSLQISQVQSFIARR
jgi:hypothetical protein